jgi:hypothetical protein
MALEASLLPVTPARTEETTPPIPPFVVVVVAVPVIVLIDAELVTVPLTPTDSLMVTPAAPVGTG